MFSCWLQSGGVGRGISRDFLTVNVTDLRQFGIGPHLQVDDYPYGGGPGMVLRPEPLWSAVESLAPPKSEPVILLSPRGRKLTHAVASGLALYSGMTLIAGHYEGVDERVSDYLVTEEISIGDYILSGGELAAMVVVDTVTRLLPGALKEQSTRDESFATGTLEYPQYTRPAVFREHAVPDILLSGHHEKIAAWRRDSAVQRTQRNRADLLDLT